MSHDYDSERTKTPLEHDLPADPVMRLHRYARDLAFGAMYGFWGPRLVIEGNHAAFSNRKDQKNYSVYMLVWEHEEPSIHLLVAFGYIELQQADRVTYGMLTRTAFDLLRAPGEAPRVFVSYRRSHSSPFALLVEARLRLAGNNAVFVDKLLEAGGEWRREIEDRIRECDYFVLLVGETTFESEWVRGEIETATDAGSVIIPVWQPDAMRGPNIPQVIDERQGIIVERESADAYEMAIVKLLNRLGYATI